jgi:4-amino-4-deoxy-L-arabinose transferase-like glycosyltransferase
MGFISRYRKEIGLGIVLIFAYFILRLIYLNRLPIFTDEAIYIRWAQIALNDASWRFISLTDGKQPLFVWFSVIFMKFVQDPLIAGRLVSVSSGFLTMIGLYVLTYELFRKRTIALFASILYIFYPFAQVLDRMALMDSMVGTFFIWSLYFSVLLVRKIRLDIAYTLGLVIGAGVLTKTSNFFSIYLLPFTLLLLDFKRPLVQKRVIRWIILAAFTTTIAYGIYSLLRLSPFFEIVSVKNATFVYPIFEWIKHPFLYFTSNFNGLFSWFLQYFTFSYITLLILSILLIQKFFKEKVLLLLYSVLPFLALALFGIKIYPRFIFFMTLTLLPLVAWSLNLIVEKLKSIFSKNVIYVKITQVILLFIIIAYPAYVSIIFAINPLKAPIADADHGQYTNSWAAGWGVKESIAFFKEKSVNQKIFVATEGSFGLMPEAMEIYLIKNKNITIKGYWPVDSFPKEVLNFANKMPAYFIFYQPQHVIVPISFPLKLIFEVRQGDTNYFYRVYQVIPSNN